MYSLIIAIRDIDRPIDALYMYKMKGGMRV